MPIYVTSDTHFNHLGIIKFSRTNFANIEEHNELIIKRWNQIVKDEDTIYHLGDVGFGNEADLAPIIARLHGKKILILGNHDRHSKDFYLKIGFNEVYNHPLYFYNSSIILSHYPLKEAYNNPYVINIHGHVHGASLNLDNFINVSVEETDYRPVSLAKLTKKANNCLTRKESFLNEWYASFYHFYKENDRGAIYKEDGTLDIEASRPILLKRKNEEDL